MATHTVFAQEEQNRLKELLVFERQVYQQGYRCVAGIDEAGRGPLAGPVVAAACILPQGLLIKGVDDSKKLSPKVREQLFEELMANPQIIYGVGIIDPEEIDRINIYQATIQAMLQAVNALDVPPDYLLVDGMNLIHSAIPSLKIIKGDQLSLSIAAASIIAKVTRDRLMQRFHQQWPMYGFEQHKGYGTALHLNALEQHGPCPIHRRSFEPVKTNCLLTKKNNLL